jgi:hypothetical protein
LLQLEASGFLDEATMQFVEVTSYDARGGILLGGVRNQVTGPDLLA